MRNMAKLIEPMFSEAISEDARSAPARRCSSVIVTLPPVVMLSTASVCSAMRGRNCMYTSADGEGCRRPDCARAGE